MVENPLAAPRASLFKKYLRALFAAVVVPLLIAGGIEAWFGYHDQRARLNDLLDAEARLAAVKIQDFVEGIRDQLGWTVLLPWSENAGDRQAGSTHCVCFARFRPSKVLRWLIPMGLNACLCRVSA